MKRRTRRWGRILFNTLTAISLLLAIATAGLWVRSYWRVDTLICDELPSYTTAIESQRGRLALDRRTYVGFNFLRGSGWRREVSEKFDPTSTQQRAFFGIGYYYLPPVNVANGSTVTIRRWTLPHGFAVTLLAIVAAPGAKSLMGKRARPGHCPACGYDTRANPEKCSECGREIATGG